MSIPAAEPARAQPVLLRIALVDLLPDPGQPRRCFEGLEELAASLKRHGQLEPIGVRPAWEGKWYVVYGERRLRAAQMATLTHLDAVTVDRPMTDAERLEIQLVENSSRQDLCPHDHGIAILRLMESRNWTAKLAAEALGMSPATVCRKLKTLRMAPEVLSRLTACEITETAAIATVSKQRAAKPKPVTFRVGKALRVTISGAATAEAAESALTEALKQQRALARG